MGYLKVSASLLVMSNSLLLRLFPSFSPPCFLVLTSPCLPNLPATPSVRLTSPSELQYRCSKCALSSPNPNPLLISPLSPSLTSTWNDEAGRRWASHLRVRRSRSVPSPRAGNDELTGLLFLTFLPLLLAPSRTFASLTSASYLSHTATVLKTHMASHRSDSLTVAIQKTYAKNGFKGFYAGLVPWVRSLTLPLLFF